MIAWMNNARQEVLGSASPERMVRRDRPRGARRNRGTATTAQKTENVREAGSLDAMIEAANKAVEGVPSN